MKTKLTLTVEKTLIEQAKVAAHARHTSISSLVEVFLSNLTLENQASFSDKWLGAFKEPAHQRSSTLLTNGRGMRPSFAHRESLRSGAAV